MLIYIPHNFICNPPKDIKGLQKSLRNILISVEQGFHDIFFEKRETLQKVIELFDKHDKLTVEFLNHLLNSYPTDVFPEFIKEYFLLSSTDSPDTPDEEERIIHHVAYTHFLNEVYLTDARIIGEDLNDCELFEYIALAYFHYHYKKSKFKNKLKLKLEHINGGGVNTARSLAKQAKNRIFVAFVDTDRVCEGVEEGSTSELCQKVELNPPFNLLHTLHMHEIENLIPLSILKKIEEHVHKPGLMEFEKIWNATESKSELLRYYDMKEGLKKKAGLKKKDDNKYRSFIFQCLSILGRFDDETEFNDYYDHLPFDTLIIDGMKKKILKNTIDYLQKKYKRIDLSELKSFQKEEWKIISSKVIAYGIARDNDRIY